MASMEGWQKALLVAGVSAGTAGLIWYLLREGEEGEEDLSATTGKVAPGNSVWKVSDSKMCAIGIRAGPDTDSARTRMTLPFGTVFEVSEIVETDNTSGVEQRYLKLADGRGWAF